LSIHQPAEHDYFIIAFSAPWISSQKLTEGVSYPWMIHPLKSGIDWDRIKRTRSAYLVKWCGHIPILPEMAFFGGVIALFTELKGGIDRYKFSMVLFDHLIPKEVQGMVYASTDSNKVKWEIVTEYRVIKTHTRSSEDPYYSYMTNKDVIATYQVGTFKSEQSALRKVRIQMKDYLNEGWIKADTMMSLTKSINDDEVDQMDFTVEEVIVSRKRL